MLRPLAGLGEVLSSFSILLRGWEGRLVEEIRSVGHRRQWGGAPPERVMTGGFVRKHAPLSSRPGPGRWSAVFLP